MIYSVINIDMVNSRKITQRMKVQEELLEMIKNFNEKYASILLSPITLTLGDEWQVVLKEPQKSYFIIDLLQQVFKKFNINIYVGVGIGKMSTGIYKDTRKMDGECFILAREAINTVKNKNIFYNNNIHSKKNRVFINAKPISVNKHRYDIFGQIAVSNESAASPITIISIINNLIENNEVLKSKITTKQHEIIELYRKYNSYKNIIENNKDTTKASISQKLNDSNYFLIKNNYYMIESMIELYIRLREGIL